MAASETNPGPQTPPPHTVAALVSSAAEEHGDALALVDGSQNLSFSQLKDCAHRVAAGLLEAGIERGDRVAIWAPNMWEWVVAALGIHCAGGVLVPVNTRYKGDEAAYLLNKSGARFLFTVQGFLDTDYVNLLAQADGDTPALEKIYVFRPTALQAHPKVLTQDFGAWFEGLELSADAAEKVGQRIASVEATDLSDIIFTSGTTGKPKGVMSQHGQTLRTFRDWSATVGLRAGDRYLVVLPFFHSFGYKAGWLACLLVGATILPQAIFDVEVVLKRVSADRISVLPGPPALYQTILARPDLASFDLSCLRLSVTGAAVIPVSLIEEMRERLSFETIITGYGLTESTGVVTMCREGDDPTTIATTSGRAIADVQVQVVDESGKEVPRGDAGEIWVRGYNVMTGYFDDAEATAGAVTAEGWLKTGDIGVMDERGYIKITDRKKDMFIVGGFNAYPAEIESSLVTHPEIVQAAVIGVPDARMGEVGLACLVLTPGSSLTSEGIIEYSRAKMANYKVPRRVEIMDALPTNATGKVQKFRLREMFAPSK